MRNKLFFAGVFVLAITYTISHLIDSQYNQIIIQIFELAISPDGNIEDPIWLEKFIINRIILLGYFWGILFILPSLFRFDEIRVKAKIVYSISILLTFLWIITGHGHFGGVYILTIYYEDQIFEQLTAILFFVSAFIVVLKLFRPDRLNIAYLIFVAFILFFVGMEEISWGQRILNWETPGIMRGNPQNETNIHGYFWQLFNPVYSLGFLTFGFLLLFLNPIKNYLYRFSWGQRFSKYLLSDDYSVMGCLFILLSVLVLEDYGKELSEEVISVFALAYALDLFQTSDSYSS